jgi:hypothetical protein
MKKILVFTLLFSFFIGSAEAMASGQIKPLTKLEYSQKLIQLKQISLREYLAKMGQQQTAQPAICKNENCTNKGLDLVIISREMFQNDLSTYAEWRRASGYKVGIITAEWIEKKYQGRTSEKIKKALSDFSANSGIKYVLIVGDAQVKTVSTKNIEGAAESFIQSDKLNFDWDIPAGYFVQKVGKNYMAAGTDLFYADLADWDSNKNGINEEQEVKKQKSGLDIYVGRWPVRTTAELKNLIEKSKKFERVNEMLIVDSSTYNQDISKLPLSSWVDNAFPYYFLPVIPATVNINFFDNVDNIDARILDANNKYLTSNVTYNKFSNASDKDAIKIKSELAKGNKYIVELAHGNHSCIYPGKQICANELIYKEYVPVFVPTSCAVSTFFEGSRDSFSESLLKQEKGPIIIVTPEDYKVFFEKLFAGKTVGQAFYEDYKLNRTQGSGWNVLLGDPTLK